MYKIALLLVIPLQLIALDLKKEITIAEPGDYIVYAHKQSLVLLRIRENKAPNLEIEEISAPTTACSSNWQKWISKNAPGHTSWTITRIDTNSGKIASIFSVDEMQFLNANPVFQFFPTLINLKLEPVAPADRKFIGPKPLAGEQDFRKPWLPKIIYENQQVFPQVQVYLVKWPDDASELAGKPIDLYFAEDKALTYLPYWIEVAAGLTKAKISALDSGKSLTSPVKIDSYEQHNLFKL